MDEEKKASSNTWLVVVLVIMVLGLGGYITYDKLVVKATKEETPKNTVVEEQKKVLLTEAEATTLGEEKYNYAFNTTLSKNFEHVNDTNIISNYDAVATNFTDNYISNSINNGFNVFASIKKNANNEYVDPEYSKGSGSTISYKVSKYYPVVITEDYIAYEVVVESYKGNTSERYLPDFSDSFVLKNVDSVWKIDNYTFRWLLR